VLSWIGTVIAPLAVITVRLPGNGGRRRSRAKASTSVEGIAANQANSLKLPARTPRFSANSLKSPTNAPSIAKHDSAFSANSLALSEWPHNLSANSLVLSANSLNLSD